MHLGFLYFYQLILSKLGSCLVFSYSRGAILRPLGDLPPKYGITCSFSFLEPDTGTPCNILRKNDNYKNIKVKFLGSRKHRSTHRLHVSVCSDHISADNPHYKSIAHTSVPLSRFKYQLVDEEDREEDDSDEEEKEDKHVPGTDVPAGGSFFKRAIAYLEDKELQKELDWRHPMPCSLSQMVALSNVKELMPPSKVNQCFNVTDGTDIDKLLGKHTEDIYSKRNIEAFFRFEPMFGFEKDGADFVPQDLEPPPVMHPGDAPILEGHKEKPSVPLGWRTFAVLAMLPNINTKRDSALLWSAPKSSEGQPMQRLASCLFQYGDLYNFAASRDAVTPEGTLLYSKEPIPPGELFCGEKGDLSSFIITEPPVECSKINKELCPDRFSDDGIWPKKYLENVLSTLTLSQMLWANLSTTIMHSTSKIIRFYRLKVRKFHKQEIFSRTNKFDVDEAEKSASKKGAIDITVGNMYFMAAPTLHHAVELVRSDPMARANLYKNLLIFEAEDALKNQILEKRNPDYKSPRQYLVLGRYSPENEYVNAMRERMTRFLIRTNCVRTYAILKSPRKDSMVDFKLPVQQLLPTNDEYIDFIVKNDVRFRDACLTRNDTEPIGDLSIINQFDYDDALDWANRIPYTRSCLYDTLFVARAEEIGFYGHNCKFSVPLPMEKSLMPVRQEYTTVKFDPLVTLAERMNDISGHIISLPKSGRVIKSLRMKMNTQIELKPSEKSDSWPKRLFITLRTTYPEIYKPKKLSSIYAREAKKKHFSVAKFKTIRFDKDKGSYLNISLERNGWKMYADRMSIEHPPCDIQIQPPLSITSRVLDKWLNENAPKELDRPFYADFLRDYVYISLPEGHFFVPRPGCTNYSFNISNSEETNPTASAEDLCRLREYKPDAIAGFWMRKEHCFLLYNNPQESYLLLAKGNTDGKNTPVADEYLKNVIMTNEIFLDLIRKGIPATWPGLSLAYSRREGIGQLVSHLSEEEMMKTAYAVAPLNQYFYKYQEGDELPACMFYKGSVYYPRNDPRHLMSTNPEALRNIQLDFIDKFDRGLVSIEDNPVKIMAEAEAYDEDMNENSVATKWEEYDVELAKRKDVKKDDSTKT